MERISQQDRWPGGWGPQGRSVTGGGGLARVPNLSVCKHVCCWGWHTQGRKDELTSCRGTVLSAWQKTPVSPKRVSGRHVVRGRQSSLILEVCTCNRQGWLKHRRLPSVVTLKALAGDQRPIQGGDRLRRRLRGRYRLGHRPHSSARNGSMNSQANVRAGKVLRPPIRALPSVIVGTEKGVAGSGWARWKSGVDSSLRVER